MVTLYLIGLFIFALNGLVMLAMLRKVDEFNSKSKRLEFLLRRAYLRRK